MKEPGHERATADQQDAPLRDIPLLLRRVLEQDPGGRPMSGRSDAWFPFYVGDYLRDTRHLTTEQHGAYMLLLMDCWSKRGPLPDNDAALAMIVGLPLRAWRRLRPALTPFFIVQNGQWVSPRMMREIERSQEISEKRKEAGKRGGRPTNSGGKPKPIASQLDKQTGLQTETHARVALPSPSEIQSSVPNGTGADAPIDADAKAWREAVDLLTANGRMPEGKARGFFGKLFKDHPGLEARDLLSSIGQAVANGTQDPQAYLTKAAANVHRRRSGGMAPSAQPATDIDWPARLKFFRDGHQWPELLWGAPPGDPQCQCPRDLLEGV